MKSGNWIREKIDLKLSLLLVAFYTLFEVIFFIKFLATKEDSHGSSVPWTQVLVYYILDWCVVLIFMHIIAITTKGFIKKQLPWKKIFLIHIILSICLGLAIRIISDVAVIFQYDLENYDVATSFKSFLSVLDLNFLIYFAMASIIYSYYYFQEVKKAEAQKASLQTKLTETRMKMLTTQLQPHFLFNTLNSITSLIDIDKGKAQHTLVDLSQFFREVLNTGDQSLVTVKRELEILSHYINILKVRFSDDLTISQSVDPSLLNVKIPALILQPIIENSIQHGYSSHHTELIVSLSIYSEKNYVVLRIENNGNLMKNSNDPFSKGMGLTNIRERLKNIYKRDFLFQIRNKRNGEGVECIVKVPGARKNKVTT